MGGMEMAPSVPVSRRWRELKVVKLEDCHAPKLVPKIGLNDRRNVDLPRGVSHESKRHAGWHKHKKGKTMKIKAVMGVPSLIDRLCSTRDENLARRMDLVKATRRAVNSLQRGSEFFSLGGVDVLRHWIEVLTQIRNNENVDVYEQVVIEILKLLQRLPVTLESMHRTRIGSLVLSLCREHTVIGDLATKINERWQSQIKQELAERQNLTALIKKLPSLNAAGAETDSVTARLEEALTVKLPSFEKALREKVAGFPLIDLLTEPCPKLN